MKIGIVCNALANSGGMERYTLDIIRGFVASGHEVTVFTRKVDASLYEATLVKTVKINTSFLPKRFRDFYVSNLLPSLRKKHPLDVMLGCCRSRHVDIVICGGTHPGFLKATRKRKSIFDRFVLPFEKASYQEASCVVAHSQLVENEIKTYYHVPKSRLFLIPPPVDLSIFKPASESILASTYEPFGLVPVESLCMGVPVVISENLGCKGYISNAVKEEFNPFSIDSLDKAIRNSLFRKDSMTRAAKGKTSEKFLVDFSLDKHIAKLLEVCELARRENAN